MPKKTRKKPIDNSKKKKPVPKGREIIENDLVRIRGGMAGLKSAC